MPSDEQLYTWEYLFKETGHHKLSISDFGWWSCQACGKSGDDWTDPKDFECVTYELNYEI